MSLAFAVAGDDPKKRRTAVRAWVEIIKAMISNSSSWVGRVAFSVEMFMHDQGLTKKEKVEGLQAIERSLTFS